VATLTIPRQDSTADQIESVAEALEETHPKAARKLRERRTADLTRAEYQKACRVAIKLLCYDAHDHLRHAKGLL